MAGAIGQDPQTETRVKVAVVQATPAILDAEGSVEKVAAWAAKAAKEGARLVLFPEAFISAYPRGLSFGTRVGIREDWGREAFAQYWEGSIKVPSPATERLGAIAREHGLFLAVGVVERDGDFGGATLYCTLLYFSPQGRLLGKHRKIKPTAAERLIWGEGDGSTIPVFDTPLGKVGGLICWENYMPLARSYLYGKGVEIYLAPTADQREGWQPTIRHIAQEGRCFVLSCNQFVTGADLPPVWRELPEMAEMPEIHCRGGSAIVGPLGEYLAGPLWDREGILLAELPPGELIKARYDFDPVGHYARPDIFRLVVDESPKPPQVIVRHEEPQQTTGAEEAETPSALPHKVPPPATH
ncbi:MAG: carbon-nitrogen hydrolase family protein [bacterium]